MAQGWRSKEQLSFVTRRRRVKSEGESEKVSSVSQLPEDVCVVAAIPSFQKIHHFTVTRTYLKNVNNANQDYVIYILKSWFLYLFRGANQGVLVPTSVQSLLGNGFIRIFNLESVHMCCTVLLLAPAATAALRGLASIYV